VREPETLEVYMIREMAAALEISGGKPDAPFYQALENERYRLGHGPWTPYEQEIKQKWEQGRSYSADLAETLRQQGEQWRERERWRTERNRKRRAEDAEKTAQKRAALTGPFRRLLRLAITEVGARGYKIFLTEMTAWLLGWLAIFGVIYLGASLYDAARSTKPSSCRTATWYLVVPPGPTSSWGVDAEAPLSEWQIDGCFDSVQNCTSERVRQQQESETESEVNQADNDSVPLTHRQTPDAVALLDKFITAQTSAARCISRDDIALKKK
jgi:hypothetical protein